MSYPLEQVIADMILRIRAEERNSEQKRIIKLLETERDTWTRQATFSYKMALTELIEKIKND